MSCLDGGVSSEEHVCRRFNRDCGADVWTGSTVLQSLLKVMEMSPSSLLLAKLDPREGDEFCPLNYFLNSDTTLKLWEEFVSHSLRADREECADTAKCWLSEQNGKLKFAPFNL